MQQPFTNNSFEHHLDNQLAGYAGLAGTLAKRNTLA